MSVETYLEQYLYDLIRFRCRWPSDFFAKQVTRSAEPDEFYVTLWRRLDLGLIRVHDLHVTMLDQSHTDGVDFYAFWFYLETRRRLSVPLPAEVAHMIATYILEAPEAFGIREPETWNQLSKGCMWGELYEGRTGGGVGRVEWRRFIHQTHPLFTHDSK